MKAIRWSHILDGSDVMNRPGYGELLTLTLMRLKICSVFQSKRHDYFCTVFVFQEN